VCFIMVCPDLASVQPAVFDEEAGRSFRGPEELGESRLDLLVQETDSLPKQTQLFSRQRRDDPDTHTHTYSIDTRGTHTRTKH
jgi:hypothetical protein